MSRSTAKSRTRHTSASPGAEGVRRDPYQLVTDKIVAAIERGTKPWRERWVSGVGSAGFPVRHNSEPYRGINVLLLWAEASERGYGSNCWMTYRQAGELGGQVRKGETGTTVVYYGTARKGEEPASQDDGPNVYRFLKTFTVFNTEQIDNLPERYSAEAPQIISAAERRAEIDDIITATGADIEYGGSNAYYRKADDRIHIPDFESFNSPELYYATIFHELGHWTRHPSRLDRDFGQQDPREQAYAKEELVAELTAAFIGAELGFMSDHLDDHATYIDSWLGALKNDKRMIFTAAAKAQAAADFILGRKAPHRTEGE